MIICNEVIKSSEEDYNKRIKAVQQILLKRK